MLTETFPVTYYNTVKKGSSLRFFETVSSFNRTGWVIVVDNRSIKVKILTAFAPPRLRLDLLLPNPEALDAPMPSSIEPTALAAFIC